MEKFETLERELAYSAARADIELLCLSAETDPETGARWYDTSSADAEDVADVQLACRYLEWRGRLVRRPDNPNIVRVLPCQE